jgi:MarR family transcriptional regulator for hemolysin
MLDYDFEESVGYWVTMTSHAIRRAIDLELAKENITFRQFEVLAWIALEGEQSQVELAERLGIEAPTLAGILSRMERDGWLERYGCPEDRRRKRIRVTPKAEAVWVRMADCCWRVRAKATEGITPEELENFKRICQQLRANVEPEPHSKGSVDEPAPLKDCAQQKAISARQG